MNKRLVVYHTNWSTYDRNFQIHDLPLHAITHLNYCFLDLKQKNDGWIPVFSDPWYYLIAKARADFEKPIGSYKGNLGALKAYKDKYTFKLGMSIGGWTFSRHFSDAVASDSSRQAFVRGIIEILEKNPGLFDIVDIDWEHISPPGCNYGNVINKTSPQDGTNFAKFLSLLRYHLDDYKPVIEITACVTGNPNMMSALPLVEMACYLDSINIMTYDFSSSSWGNCLSGHHSNLYSTSYSPLSVDKAVDAYLSAGIPACKIVIGAALYSRGFANTAGIGKASSGLVTDKSWEDGVCDYKSLPRAGAVEYWDELACASYSYDLEKKILNSYDTPLSVREKAKYIWQKGLQGIILWESSGDYPFHDERSILRELYHSLNK